MLRPMRTRLTSAPQGETSRIWTEQRSKYSVLWFHYFPKNVPSLRWSSDVFLSPKYPARAWEQEVSCCGENPFHLEGSAHQDSVTPGRQVKCNPTYKWGNGFWGSNRSGVLLCFPWNLKFSSQALVPQGALEHSLGTMMLMFIFVPSSWCIQWMFIKYVLCSASGLNSDDTQMNSTQLLPVVNGTG